eukprot:g717.t1
MAEDHGATDEQTLAQVERLRDEAKQTPAISSLIDLRAFATDATEFPAPGGGSVNIFSRKLLNLAKEVDVGVSSESAGASSSSASRLFTQMRKCRRDGNCFYRSYLFGLMHEMCVDVAFRQKTFAKIKGESLGYCETAGYDKFALEGMWEETVEVLASIFPEQNAADGASKASAVPASSLEKLFQSDDLNYPICFLRCLTSSYLKHNRDEYFPFLMDSYGSVDAFCQQEVDPMWREADQLQIQALASFFRVPIRIFYLDQSEGEFCTPHELAFEGGPGARFVINFLYRPGHYELLY